MTLVGGVITPSEVLNYLQRTQRYFSLDPIVRGKAAQKLRWAQCPASKCLLAAIWLQANIDNNLGD